MKLNEIKADDIVLTHGTGWAYSFGSSIVKVIRIEMNCLVVGNIIDSVNPTTEKRTHEWVFYPSEIVQILVRGK